MTKIKVIIIFFLVFGSISGQRNLNEVLDSYEAYFQLARQTVFVHTNKTTYLPGEKIWFTAYMMNRETNLPFEGNSILICGLFNEQGILVKQASIKVTDGAGSGYFEIPKDFGQAHLFLRAGTNWMKNFAEDDSFVTQLSVEPQREPTTVVSISKDEIYDIGFMPEGGHLIENVSNTVGFKILNKTGPTFEPESLKLSTPDGNTIVNSIKTDKHGTGRFEFIPLPGKEYVLEAQMKDGQIIAQTLEPAKSFGLTLSINNLFQDKVTILVKTNKATLAQIKGKDHFIAVHKDGFLTLTTFQLDNTEQTVSIAKEDFFPGVNIITVFDSNINPILERLIFNDNELNRQTAQIERVSGATLKDSTELKIALPIEADIKAKLSVSVLPEGTESMNPQHTIFSTFWINPYIKGHIENAAYYFNDLNRKKKYELDNILLTQGWSRYDWENIFNDPPQQAHSPEQGYSITGKVLNATASEEGITFYQKPNPKFYETKIDNAGSFAIENATIYKNENVFASLTDAKGKTKKPELEHQILPQGDSSNVRLQKRFLKSLPKDYKVVGAPPKIPLNPSSFFVDEGTIELKEVTVSEDKIENKLVRNTNLSGGLFTGLKITEYEAKLRPNLQILIQSLGYRTRDNPVTGELTVLPRSTVPGVRAPVIIVDDIVMVDYSRGINFLPVNFFRTLSDSIDEIYYTHTPVEMGNRPAIYIYLKYGREPIARFASFIAKNGFQRPKEFYNPKYVSYTSNEFSGFGTIHWENQLLINEKGETGFTIPNLSQKNVAVFVEGILNDGSLVSESRVISLE